MTAPDVPGRRGPGAPPPAAPRPAPPRRRSRARADARLVPGAAAAWAAAWGAPLIPLRATVAVSVCAGACAAVLACRPTIRRRAMLAVVLVCVAAGGLVAGLRTAADHDGPVAAAARQRAEATVELTVRTDPERRVTRVRGSELGSPPTVFEARIDRIDTSGGPPGDPRGGSGGPGASGTPRMTGARVRTPVTVLADGPDAGAWLGLLPSTPIRVQGRLVPGRSGQALLLIRAAPHRIGAPAAHQRFAGLLRARLRAACAELPPAARGLLPGLVVGDTSRLPADLEADFRTTELTHLTAVSGTNITILLGFVLFVLRRAGVHGRTLPIAGAVAVACFVVVARPEPSVLRAAAMGLVTVVALYTGRPRRGLPALAVAVLGLVLLDPTLARSYGFALSALATGALLLLAPHWTSRLRARGWPTWAAVLVAVPLAAQAVCGPLVVTFAGRVSLMAVPCNLLAEFAVAPATILGFVTLLLAPICLPLARLTAWLGSWPIAWIAAVARTGADLPGAAVTWPTGLFGGVALAVITIAAVPTLRLLRRTPRSERSGRGRAMTTALLATLAVVLLLRPPMLVRPLTGWPPPGWHLVMCDVGQGDAIVLNAGAGAGVLIDAGPDPDAVDGCLRDLGIRRLPLILLSHYHADHVEGLPGALRGRGVGLVQGTPVLDPPGEVTRVRRWAAGAGVALTTPGNTVEHRTLGSLTWQTLAPSDSERFDGPRVMFDRTSNGHCLPAARPGPIEVGGSGAVVAGGGGLVGEVRSGRAVGGSVANNASLVVLAERHGVRMLLTGDAEVEAQEALRGRLAGVRVDVLKVAHHGSARQDPAFVLGLRPRLALVSVGKDNPYGHPSPSARALVAASGARLLRTDTDGPIAVTGSPAHLRAVARGPATTHAHQPPVDGGRPAVVVARSGHRGLRILRWREGRSSRRGCGSQRGWTSRRGCRSQRGWRSQRGRTSRRGWGVGCWKARVRGGGARVPRRAGGGVVSPALRSVGGGRGRGVAAARRLAGPAPLRFAGGGESSAPLRSTVARIGPSRVVVGRGGVGGGGFRGRGRMSARPGPTSARGVTQLRCRAPASGISDLESLCRARKCPVEGGTGFRDEPPGSLPVPTCGFTSSSRYGPRAIRVREYRRSIDVDFGAPGACVGGVGCLLGVGCLVGWPDECRMIRSRR
ncbi:ComEC/Rec2 family competence protein [Embleya hyalina]|uniref:Membrane protein n=1 Tax=Embleya hyalina TaxID=516124 RepID=A0A401YPG8_9ACTN|nr:ComEC/Rec2 family competence protein [Embleya hyalina]GCD96477.1 membrane protein [Embleya hyalina]